MARLMQITTPLGEDTLLFHRLQAREELSRPFEHQLTLLSGQRDIDLDALLGKQVSVQLSLPNGRNRYFSGYLTRFAQSGMVGRYHRYTATSRPWLWFLTRTADCRIFQDMTVPDIIKKVFADHPTADFEFKLSAAYRTWTYCVQYRETDFNFVSRLMEQEGIYYYFRHDQGRHTLVLVDSTSAHTVYEDYGTIPYVVQERARRVDQEYIDGWDLAHEIQPGVYTHDDYDFERPSAVIRTNKNINRRHNESKYEIYDFPGEYLQKTDGDHYAAVRMDELSTRFEVAHGTTNARGLCVGATFRLSGQPREDQNREYLAIGAGYDLEFSAYEGLPEPNPGSYHCSFGALTTQQQFRPARITAKPHVSGPQTAVVVGPAGDEIYTDKYGRVKVQFRWDRYGKKDENSSCWMRVSHPWAGKNWGMIALPRIGQEVIVDFLEGDPDEPIITGRVYNAEQMPPYALPANQTRATTKSRSTKGGTANQYNEIRFEDKVGSEQIFINAERDLDLRVENDAREYVSGDRSLIVNTNQRELVNADKHGHVKGAHLEKVDGDVSLNIGGKRMEKTAGDHSSNVGGDRKEQVAGARALTVGQDQSEQIGGNLSLQVGQSRNERVGQTHALEAGQAIHLRGGMTVVIEAGMRLSLKGPGGFIDIGPTGVSIQGTLVMINSGGAAGSGPGASPQSPATPDAPHEPKDPDKADDGTKGGKL